MYFTLKDPRATLKAVVWAGNRRRLSLDLKNGLQVVAAGNISLYEPRGEYQLIVTDLRAAGLGDLYEAFEKLKKQLAAEGLFDPASKIPLPFLPRGVGIVTSPTGAVIQDIFRVIRRRFPNMPLFLVPVKVQGEGAAAEIARGIRRLDGDDRVDVIIVARGGGSLEDLWAFNEEITARAIFQAQKPVISAVGHETDTTIADFVADRRAPTPSVAGELVVPVKEDLVRDLLDRRSRLSRALRGNLQFQRKRLEKAGACRFLKHPHLMVSERRLRLANLARQGEVTFRDLFKVRRHRFDLLRARLEGLNPTALLQRGYVLGETGDGRVVTSATQIRSGDRLILRMHDGKALTTVDNVQLAEAPSRKGTL